MESTLYKALKIICTHKIVSINILMSELSLDEVKINTVLGALLSSGYVTMKVCELAECSSCPLKSVCSVGVSSARRPTSEIYTLTEKGRKFCKTN